MAKDAAKRGLKLWSEEGGAAFFILRGGHAVTAVLTAATLSNLVRKVAEPTAKMTGMLLSLSDMDVLAFGPPVPEGWSQFPRHPAKHFAIFIKVLGIVIGYGTEASSDISKVRRAALLGEIRAVQERLEEFTDHHASQLHHYKEDVEKRITGAINAGIKDFFGELKDEADKLRQEHAFVAPVSGSGQPPKSPRFEQLSCLVDRSHTHNLIGRLDNGLVAPLQKAAGKTGAGKRKSVDTGDLTARARPRNQPVGAASSSAAFIQSMSDWKTPAGVCASGWRGQKCERVSCKYDHDKRHPNVPPPPPGPPPAPAAAPTTAVSSATPVRHNPPPPAAQASVARFSGNHGRRSNGAGGSSN